MNRTSKGKSVTRYFEVTGWIVGFVAAVGTDYCILPRLVFAHGGKPLAGVIALMVSVLSMFLCVEVSARLGNRFQVGNGYHGAKTPGDKIPLRFRIVIGSVAAILTLSMVFNGLEGLNALWRAFR